MSAAPFNLTEAEIAALEAANGLRQIDTALEMVDWYLQPNRPFNLRPMMLQELQKVAVEGLEPEAGQFRTTKVEITESKHEPPPPHLVEMRVLEMCEHVNNNWHEKNAFYLSSYVMWRLNWIHPFAEGNGRTSRALSYAVLCIKLGYRLPGTPTIPAQIQADRTAYFKALEAADEAWLKDETIDLSAMEDLLKAMLANQLLSVIDRAAGAQTPLSGAGHSTSPGDLGES